MRKVLGVIVAIIIVWIMGAISTILKAMIEVSRANMEDIGQFQYVIMGLVPLIPLIIAIWLIKLSWRKITAKKEQENEDS